MVLVHRYKRNNRGIIINKIQYCIKECDVYIVLERYEIRIWKKSAEVFHQGARLRRLNKRTDNFMKLVRADKADTANEPKPSFGEMMF